MVNDNHNLSSERIGAPAPVPDLRIIRGDATEEEVAAVVATIAAARQQAVAAAERQAAGDGEKRQSVREWNNKSRLMRPPVHPSPGGWRRSALPR